MKKKAVRKPSRVNKQRVDFIGAVRKTGQSAIAKYKATKKRITGAIAGAVMKVFRKKMPVQAHPSRKKQRVMIRTLKDDSIEITKYPNGLYNVSDFNRKRVQSNPEKARAYMDRLGYQGLGWVKSVVSKTGIWSYQNAVNTENTVNDIFGKAEMTPAQKAGQIVQYENGLWNVSKENRQRTIDEGAGIIAWMNSKGYDGLDWYNKVTSESGIWSQENAKNTNETVNNYFSAKEQSPTQTVKPGPIETPVAPAPAPDVEQTIAPGSAPAPVRGSMPAPAPGSAPGSFSLKNMKINPAMIAGILALTIIATGKKK